MLFLSVLFFLILGSESAQDQQLDETRAEGLEPYLASLGSIYGLLKEGGILEFHVRPVLPVIELDLLPMKNLRFKIPNNSGISRWVHGNFDFCTVDFVGGPRIWSDIGVDLIEFPKGKVKFRIETEKFGVQGLHQLAFNIFQDVLPITSRENFNVFLNFISLEVTFVIPNVLEKVKFDDLDINIKGKGLEIFFENAVLGELETIKEDWVSYSGAVTYLLTGFWKNIIKRLVMGLAPGFLNNLAGECYPLDLAKQNFTCIKIPKLPTFPGLEEPTLAGTQEFQILAELAEMIMNVEELEDGSVCDAQKGGANTEERPKKVERQPPLALKLPKDIEKPKETSGVKQLAATSLTLFIVSLIPYINQI